MILKNNLTNFNKIANIYTQRTGHSTSRIYLREIFVSDKSKLTNIMYRMILPLLSASYKFKNVEQYYILFINT